MISGEGSKFTLIRCEDDAAIEQPEPTEVAPLEKPEPHTETVPAGVDPETGEVIAEIEIADEDIAFTGEGE